MSNNLVPIGSFLPSRTDRSVNRALSQVRAHQAVVTAQETAKLEIIGDVTEAALMTASHITAVEIMLAQRTPDPVSQARLRAVADAGVLGLAEVVMKTARTVR